MKRVCKAFDTQGNDYNKRVPCVTLKNIKL